MRLLKAVFEHTVGVIALLVAIPLLFWIILTNAVAILIWAPFFLLGGVVVYLVERFGPARLRLDPPWWQGYTKSDWNTEDAALKAGGDPPQCPQCQRHGFYAPRFATPKRFYRACKFCGLWQDVGNSPEKIIRYECVKPDHSVADWKKPYESWTCPVCETPFAPADAVSWPADDPDHPWHQAPGSGTQSEYIAFWTNSGSQAPKFGIP